MKTIIRLISAALFLFAATACNLTEINNPDDPNNNGSGKKEYSITAKIIQTRVLYTDGEVLKQEWEIGDRLIGCYKTLFYVNDEPMAMTLPISFTVKDIDSNGIAKLKLESGTLPEDGTKIALIYDPYGNSELSNGELTVDLSTQSFDIGNQSGTVLPAFMSASADYTKAKGAEFVFQNDCAIIEVDGISSTGGTNTSDVSSISINNVIAQGSYQYVDDQFTLSGTSTKTITVSCNRTLNWETGALDKPVFLAVIPNKTSKDIDVTFFDKNVTICNVPRYGTTSFDAGKCYVIYPKDMVAKTSDNQYFTTVTAAFEHADDLYNAENSIYNSAEKNIVTILKDCGLAGVELKDGEYKPLVGESEPIDIDGYDVTLDLNGHTLSIGGEECFRVDFNDYDEWTENTDTFTINDFVGDGGIMSSSSDYLIKSYYKVNIINGIFTSANCSMILNGKVEEVEGILTVEGGTLHSDGYNYVIDNYGTVYINNGSLNSIDCTIWNYDFDDDEGESHKAKVVISGGSVFSTDSEAVDDGDVSVTGGKIKSKSLSAISTEGNIEISGNCIIESEEWVAISAISGADLTMSGGKVSGALGGIHLTDGSTGKITGGTIESEGEEETEDGYALYIDNSTCTISGGTILNKSTTKPAIYCFTGVDKQNDFNTDSPNLIIQWNNGSSASDVSRKVDPLIVSNADPTENNRSFGPISIKKSTTGDDNYAVVMVAGGYLFSKDDACYSIESIEGVRNLLWIPDGCYFYTNETSDNNKPHYFDFGLSENNLVEVPFKTVSIDYYSYHFAYKIIPGYPGTDLAPVEIGGITWAPVNCGYDENHPYGLLYQWGRKYGQGYGGEPEAPSDCNFKNIEESPLTAYPDQDDTNAGKFFYGSLDLYHPNEFVGNITALWDESNKNVVNFDPFNPDFHQYSPTKTANDPCPKGWRVPTYYEFYLLEDDNIQDLNLPFAGYRDEYGKMNDSNGSGYYWTSSVEDYYFYPLCFYQDSQSHGIMQGYYVYGCSIRCVKE